MLPAWKAWKWGLVRGIALNILIFSGGGFIAQTVNSRQLQNAEFTSVQRKEKTYLATMDEPSQKKNGRFRAVASLFEILPGRQKINRGKAILYFPKEGSEIQIPYGSILVINARVQPMQHKLNPGQFDYVTYYARQGIYYQLFLQDREFQILSGNTGNWFNHFLFNTKEKILQILQTNIKNKEAVGLAEALLIGYRNDLDQSVLTAYANTGVVHVIAISGLHLGLLFEVLMSLTSIWGRNGKKKWLQFAIVIPFLWIFSIMTGGSASVIRSAFMFSLLGIGGLIEKKGNPLNTLGAAAFLLLSFQPTWVLDTGFQLSFAAVASIIVYYKSIRQLVYFRNPAALKCWEMIAVTLSAQILTTPLIFFYFKQFPVFFLLTNLVAVPLSGWILLGELLLCILYPLQGIAIKLGFVLEKSILLLNAYVFRMDSIPFSSIRDIYVLPVQVFLLYVIVFGITLWLRLKLKTGFWIMFSSLLLFSIASLNQNLRIYRQQKLVILNLNGGPALLLVNGKSGVLLTNKPGKANYAPNNNKPETVKQYFKLRNLEKEELPAGGMIQISQEGRSILICRDKEINKLPLPLPKTDFFILSSNTGISMEFLFQKTHCQNWIADGTNSMWKIQEWKRAAERLHLRFHSVNESGAFIHDF